MNCISRAEFNAAFSRLFGQQVQGVSSAPGRVNLIGEFTDYNLGFVLPAALNFRTQVAFAPRQDGFIRVCSLNYPGESDQFALAQPLSQGPSQWGNYVRAVVFVLQRAGHVLHGADLLISSDVPQGAGLSSSAALEVAVAGALSALSGLQLSPAQLALFGQQAENDFMDCQCGIMDQMCAATAKPGQAMLLDCQSLETRHYPIPASLSLVIINSNYPRKLVDSEYNARRQDCETACQLLGVASLRDASLADLTANADRLPPQVYRRAHHVISENARVLAAVAALSAADLPRLRQLMAASHQSLRDDFAVTVPATDGLVEICAKALGEQGAVRMTGGGFGGAIICLCPPDLIPQVQAAVAAQYQARFGLQADIYVCTAGTGWQLEFSEEQANA